MKKQIFISITIVTMVASVISLIVGNTGLFFLFLAAMIFSIILTNVLSSTEKAEQSRKNLESINKLLSENNVIKGQFYTNDNQSDSIVLDEKNAQVAIIKQINDDYKLYKFPFSSIVESELKEDGVSIIKTSKGAAVGGTLLTGIGGGIIGSLVANKTSQDEVRKIQLNLTVDDLSSPIHTIDFMKLTKNHIKKDNPYFIERFNQATHWHKMLSVIINRQSNNQSASNH